jgi:phosphoglucomutase/phosphomannomutase
MPNLITNNEKNDEEVFFTKIQKALEGKKLNPTAAENIKRWLTGKKYREFYADLRLMVDNEEFVRLNDCFYTVIPFGTSGRRGPVGIGTNRINFITISESAQAVANYLFYIKNNKTCKAVIAYDTRHYSTEFGIRTAEVFAGNGILVYIFENFRSTPELSFAVRELKADIGVVISASHNPPSDNGFKAYWADGGQIIPPHDQGIINEVQKIIDEVDQSDIKRIPIDEAINQGLVKWIGEEIDKKYLASVCRESLLPESNNDIHILYTPLHGTGTTSVLPVLQHFGYHVDVLKEQEKPDGDFPEVKNHIPNPEDPAVLELAITKAKELSLDIVLASDPDADRLGVAVPLSNDKKEWITLTGNQIASLLTYFVLDQLQKKNAIQQNGVVTKTLVTTDLMTDICNSFDVHIIKNLLVGFKYIAEVINEAPELFIVGAEESHGFLKGSYTRDKDAAVAALLMTELTGYLKKQNKTPYQFLDELCRKYGYYKDVVKYIILEGEEGKRQIELIMDELRNHPPEKIGELKVIEIHDYKISCITNLLSGERQTLESPKDNLLIFMLSQDGRTRVSVRPSGTEPKLKYYVSVYSEVRETITEDELTRIKEVTNALATAIVQDIFQMAEVLIAEVLSIRYKDLYEIMQTFATPFDTENVAKVVVKTARKIVKAEASALFVKDEQKNRISLLAQEGYSGFDKDVFYDLSDEDDMRHITPWIYQKEESVKIDFEDDFQQHPAYQNRFKGGKYSRALNRGERSLIGIPLMLGNETWAVLKVVNALESKPHFNDGDRLTLEGLGRLYMTALENSHRMEHQTELARKLVDFAGEKEKLYDEIVEECNNLLYSEATSMFLFDKGKKSLCLAAVAGFWKEFKGKISYKIDDQKLTTWIAKHPEQIVKLDSQDELRKHPAYGTNYTGGKYDSQIWASGSECYSFLGTALIDSKGKVIGVLKVENKKPKNTAFNMNDVQLLKFISNIIVLAITRMT